jgi:hypothetical protein
MLACAAAAVAEAVATSAAAAAAVACSLCCACTRAASASIRLAASLLDLAAGLATYGLPRSLASRRSRRRRCHARHSLFPCEVGGGSDSSAPSMFNHLSLLWLSSPSPGLRWLSWVSGTNTLLWFSWVSGANSLLWLWLSSNVGLSGRFRRALGGLLL